MKGRIQSIVSLVFVVLAVIVVITGIGGGGFDFTTGEWFISNTATLTENRIVGGLLIAFGVLLSRLK